MDGKKAIALACIGTCLAACSDINLKQPTGAGANQNNRDRVYDWSPGKAAAIGVDQWIGDGPGGHAKTNGMKMCVLTAASANTSATSASGSINVSSPSKVTVSANGSVIAEQGVVMLHNENAAATWLDIALFHLCMMSANTNTIDQNAMPALVESAFRSSLEIAKAGSQWAPNQIAQPPDTQQPGGKGKGNAANTGAAPGGGTPATAGAASDTRPTAPGG
jgi:hypothetical protein